MIIIMPDDQQKLDTVMTPSHHSNIQFKNTNCGDPEQDKCESEISDEGSRCRSQDENDAWDEYLDDENNDDSLEEVDNNDNNEEQEGKGDRFYQQLDEAIPTSFAPQQSFSNTLFIPDLHIFNNSQQTQPIQTSSQVQSDGNTSPMRRFSPGNHLKRRFKRRMMSWGSRYNNMS
jgi:hypothetical protein